MLNITLGMLMMVLFYDKDFLNTCKHLINKTLKTIKLELSQQKSTIFKLSQGVNFLGYIIRYLELT